MSVSTETYSNYRSYVKGQEKSMTKSTTFQIGRESEVSAEVTIPGIPVTVGATRKIKPLFSSEFGESRTASNTRSSMTQDDISLMVSTATCEHFWFKLKKSDPPPFDPTFITWLRKLEDAASANDTVQDITYKEFTDRFGTHFIDAAVMGARMKIETSFKKSQTSQVSTLLVNFMKT